MKGPLHILLTACFASIAPGLGSLAQQPQESPWLLGTKEFTKITAPKEIIACVAAPSTGKDETEEGIKKAFEEWRRLAIERGVRKATPRFTVSGSKQDQVTNYVCAGIDEAVLNNYSFQVRSVGERQGIIKYCESLSLKKCLDDFADITKADKDKRLFPRTIGWTKPSKPGSIDEMRLAIFDREALSIQGEEVKSDGFTVSTGGLKPVELGNEPPRCDDKVGLCTEGGVPPELRGYIMFWEPINVVE